MKRWLGFALVFCSLVPLGALAQPVAAASAPSLDLQAQRQQLQAERTRLEALYDQEAAICYARFAVTDCLEKVRLRRRLALDGLRRQERALNDAERRQAGQAQLDRIEAKGSRPSEAP